ncbi:MAG: Na+ dependent nucleoside transporter N-terminal domain-containing protein, partial [Planctomycetota bacterium]
MDRLHGFIGIAMLLGVAWLLSEARRRIRPRVVIVGLLLQFALALLLLKVPGVAGVFDHVA